MDAKQTPPAEVHQAITRIQSVGFGEAFRTAIEERQERRKLREEDAHRGQIPGLPANHSSETLNPEKLCCVLALFIYFFRPSAEAKKDRECLSRKPIWKCTGICKSDSCEMLKEVKVRTRARRSSPSCSPNIIWMESSEIDPPRENFARDRFLNAAWLPFRGAFSVLGRVVRRALRDVWGRNGDLNTAGLFSNAPARAFRKQDNSKWQKTPSSPKGMRSFTFC